MSRLERVFEPIRIGDVTIPNRVVRTAHGTWIAHVQINDELIAYHVARAKGGCADSTWLSRFRLEAMQRSTFTRPPDWHCASRWLPTASTGSDR